MILRSGLCVFTGSYAKFAVRGQEKVSARVRYFAEKERALIEKYSAA